MGSLRARLKTLEDALEIRRRVLLAFECAERDGSRASSGASTFVLIGGGPTGVELAGNACGNCPSDAAPRVSFDRSESGTDILVEAGPTILPSFPEKLRDAARKSLVRLGVEVREGIAVTNVDAHGVMLGAERIRRRHDTLDGWCRCFTSRDLARCPSRPSRRRGKPDLSIPNPDVFVVGDAAAFADETGRQLPGVAQVAIQQATHAAKMIVNRLRGIPSTPFVFHDRGNMAIVGRGAAIADLGWIRFSGFPAWLAWLFLHIVKLVGFRNRLIVLLEWAVAYMTFQRSARLITNVNRSDRSERPDPPSRP